MARNHPKDEKRDSSGLVTLNDTELGLVSGGASGGTGGGGGQGGIGGRFFLDQPPL